ncbi:hypothetical protein Y1Q_0003264 [Alligator mississippiensis]|uniref:Uncharacterized protein n=1 Tax=Alligator mississippiensis TaxID=8496 RepID=A0A151ME43_ALLMI|nr:hypothetical protein Y1Q_0003264 [Alligator mississippiensis]
MRHEEDRYHPPGDTGGQAGPSLSPQALEHRAEALETAPFAWLGSTGRCAEAGAEALGLRSGAARLLLRHLPAPAVFAFAAYGPGLRSTGISGSRAGRPLPDGETEHECKKDREAN